MKCNQSDNCGWSKCPHFKEHEKLINIFNYDLCEEGKCHLLKMIVKCIEKEEQL